MRWGCSAVSAAIRLYFLFDPHRFAARTGTTSKKTSSASSPRGQLHLAPGGQQRLHRRRPHQLPRRQLPEGVPTVLTAVTLPGEAEEEAMEVTQHQHRQLREGMGSRAQVMAAAEVHSEVVAMGLRLPLCHRWRRRRYHRSLSHQATLKRGLCTIMIRRGRRGWWRWLRVR